MKNFFALAFPQENKIILSLIGLKYYHSVMLSSMLNSERAIQVDIAIMRNWQRTGNV